jgi:hypothetical protein
MRMASCSRYGWTYRPVYGLVGMLLAGVVLLLMRHDLSQGLTWAVVITSAAGWTRARRTEDGSSPARTGS